MALGIHHCRPNPLRQLVKLHTWPFPSGNHLPYNRPRTQTLCLRHKNSGGDSNLASDFAVEVSRINTNRAQKEEAMKKSRELLFRELCKFMDLEEEKVKKRWSEMESEEDKMVLVKGFVDVWGANFQPLSARSVKELIEEHIQEQKEATSELSSAFLPGLRRLMGFATE